MNADVPAEVMDEVKLWQSKPLDKIYTIVYLEALVIKIKTAVQLCIVHQIRHSLRFVGWKNRKIVAKDLHLIYCAKTIDEAELALTSFSEKWDKQYPAISKSWLDKWGKLTPFFAYSPEIRKVIDTTNAVESLNMSLRKVIKHKRVFPNDDATLKQLYLALKNISKK